MSLRLSTSVLLSALLLAALAAETARGKQDELPAAEAVAGGASAERQSAIAELKFSDFFRLPVGPYGLEPTAKLLSLNGKRVAIRGYIVRRQISLPGAFLLAPYPVVMSDEADGPADDLPAAHLLALLPGDDARRPVPYQRGLFLLTGTLELGAREEQDGRIYFARLHVEAPKSATSAIGPEGEKDANDKDPL